MQVGIALNMLSQPGRVDATVLHEHMSLGDLAEPLGFDSLFALEHHFTGYAMSPAPLQFLTYYAGRTRRIQLGTAVVVVPWHDPIRIAEQIALLDIMCGGRCLFGFGRGAARDGTRTREKVLADALLDKTGGDTMAEVLEHLRAYEASLAAR